MDNVTQKMSQLKPIQMRTTIYNNSDPVLIVCVFDKYDIILYLLVLGYAEEEEKSMLSSS